jgi:hypothetical protein
MKRAGCLFDHLVGDDLLDRIELRRASLFEIAEFEDAGAK